MVKRKIKMLLVLQLGFAAFWVNTFSAMENSIEMRELGNDSSLFGSKIKWAAQSKDPKTLKLFCILSLELSPKPEVCCFNCRMGNLLNGARSLETDPNLIYRMLSKDQRWNFSPILSEFITRMLNKGPDALKTWLNGVSNKKLYHDIVSICMTYNQGVRNFLKRNHKLIDVASLHSRWSELLVLLDPLLLPAGMKKYEDVRKCFFYACRHGSLKLFRKLCSHYKSFLDKKTIGVGFRLAVDYGHLKIVEELIACFYSKICRLGVERAFVLAAENVEGIGNALGMGDSWMFSAQAINYSESRIKENDFQKMFDLLLENFGDKIAPEVLQSGVTQHDESSH